MGQGLGSRTATRVEESMPISFVMIVSALVGYALAAAAIAVLLRCIATLRWQAGHDELTGLWCRRAASRLVSRRQQDGRATTLVLLDMDHFKAVNDTLGHRAGDQLLAAVGSRLSLCASRMDARAARFGGDEFLLVLPAASAAEHARQVHSVLAALSEPVYADSHRGPVAIRPSATAGVASASDSNWARLLAAADYALHEAKRVGTRVLYCDGGDALGFAPDRQGAHPISERRDDAGHLGTLIAERP
jgi:diguanylate cyclase (GGDEF)-like protein